MKKIVILGCENSHADIFLRFINQNPKYSDVQVLGVYSEESEPPKVLNEKFGVKIMERYDEFVGQVDGVINVARHGDNHYKYLAPYIKDGVPMFVDKPVCISEEEAVKFMKEAKENGCKVTGGSSLKHDAGVQLIKKQVEENYDGKTCGGMVRAAIDYNSEYGGFYFYAQHFAEITMEAFGRFPKTVTAYKTGGEEFKKGDCVTIVLKYDDYCVTGIIGEDINHYYIARASETKFEGHDIIVDVPVFKGEFDEFYELLDGKDQFISYKEFIAPVFVMNAIERAIKSGKEEKVNEFDV